MLYGLKITQQRLVIYQVLFQLNHLTTDAIYEYIWLINPSISLSTVYKTLNIFAENNLVYKLMAKEGCMRYDAHVQRHSHIYDVDTTAIADFNDAALYQMISSYFELCKMHHLKIKQVTIQQTTA